MKLRRAKGAADAGAGKDLRSRSLGLLGLETGKDEEVVERDSRGLAWEKQPNFSNDHTAYMDPIA